MGKNKLHKWAEMDGYSHVIQPLFEDVFRKDYLLKGRWQTDFFKNNNPIVLELGCGKGEYTTGLARSFPEKNFLGIDIKGARMWKGARAAFQENLKNVGFLRTRIELIESFFAENEIDEIWITFPDPQLKKRRNKKRLTSARFLNSYRTFIKESGLIHLKTDSKELFDYTNEVLKQNSLEIITSTSNLYSGNYKNDIVTIRTFYEQLFLNEGKKITYTCFKLKPNTIIKEIKSDDE